MEVGGSGQHRREGSMDYDESRATVVWIELTFATERRRER